MILVPSCTKSSGVDAVGKTHWNPGTGLSTLELRRRFPEAQSLKGVDLSPHFLAVARVMQRRRGAPPCF